MGKKIDEQVTCPYCGETHWYTYYVGSEDLGCNGCGMSFFIEETIKVVIKSKKKYCRCLCGEEREVFDCFKTIPDKKGHYTQDCEIVSYIKASECKCGLVLDTQQTFNETGSSDFYSK